MSHSVDVPTGLMAKHFDERPKDHEVSQPFILATERFGVPRQRGIGCLDPYKSGRHPSGLRPLRVTLSGQGRDAPE